MRKSVKKALDGPPKPSANPLEDISPEVLAGMSDTEYQGNVRKHARSKTIDAMHTIEDVMHNSDDDQARLIAANKYLKIAKAEEEEKFSALPNGISPEVFAIALAGLGKLVSIAAGTTVSARLRDVTPAKADPRPFIPDDSPLNLPAVSPSIEDYNAPGADVIEENAIDVEEE
jgi:hypothetical protein